MRLAGNTHSRASTAAALAFAWQTGTFRADHLIAAAKLTRATALSALDELVEVGLIRELPVIRATDKPKLGRPARRFELNSDAGVVLGVDAGNRRLTAVAADLAGNTLTTEHRELPEYVGRDDPKLSDRGFAERRESVFSVIDSALTRIGRTREDVFALCVGIPAPVDGNGKSPAHSQGWWQYMNSGMQDALASEFAAVRVENDAALAAIAENNLGQARNYSNFVALISGRRLGAGVYLSGNLVRGAHGAVGELAGLTHIASIGGTDGFGRLAEIWARNAFADGRIPSRHPWARLVPGPPSEDAQQKSLELSAEALLADASLSDPITAPLIEELGQKLGRICSVLTHFYDPEAIMVCGAVASALGEVIDVARQHMRGESDLPAPRLLASDLSGDVVSLGATAAARQAALQIALSLQSRRR